MEAFKYLNYLMQIEPTIKGTLLNEGFYCEGTRITLKGQQGIWKPKAFNYPISITSMLDGPYADSLDENGILKYKYRGDNPYHSNNMALRRAYHDKVPLIFFQEVSRHEYSAVWPIYIHEDNPKGLYVKATVEPLYNVISADSWNNVILASPNERRYAVVESRRRLHQGRFRAVVLTAYKERCAMCNLGHRELLDAAHIIPDSEIEGVASIDNGISLCKIHHAAYDQNFIGIDPDFTIHVKKELLVEIDGPMLEHGLKRLNNRKIILPTKVEDRPNRDNLDSRFQQFSKQ